MPDLAESLQTTCSVEMPFLSAKVVSAIVSVWYGRHLSTIRDAQGQIGRRDPIPRALRAEHCRAVGSAVRVGRAGGCEEEGAARRRHGNVDEVAR